MTDSEKLDLLLSKMDSMESKMDSMESRMDSMESKINSMDEKLTETRLHIENVTDHNIRLLAENHSNLIDKLNQAIPAANKNLIYEVKVNFLVDEVAKLNQEVAEIKSKTA